MEFCVRTEVPVLLRRVKEKRITTPSAGYHPFPSCVSRRTLSLFHRVVSGAFASTLISAVSAVSTPHLPGLSYTTTAFVRMSFPFDGKKSYITGQQQTFLSTILPNLLDQFLLPEGSPSAIEPRIVPILCFQISDNTDRAGKSHHLRLPCALPERNIPPSRHRTKARSQSAAPFLSVCKMLGIIFSCRP